MRKSRFFLLSVTFLIGLEMWFSGCGRTDSVKSGGSDNTTKIQVGEIEHNPAYAPFYVALEEGYFEREGLNIKLLDAGDEQELKKYLLSGECSIGILGSDAAILSEGENQIINFALLTIRAEPSLLAREPIEKLTPKMLSDACVLTSNPGMDGLVFRYILEKNGISEGELTFEGMRDSDMVLNSFQNGEGDFALLPKHYALELEETKEGYSVMDLGKESGNVPYSSFCVGREYLENHKQILIAYTKALQYGMDFVSEHNEEEIAEKISEMFPKTEKKDLIKIIKDYKTVGIWKEDTVFEKREYAILQNILMDCGKISESVAYDKTCTEEFSKMALKDAGYSEKGK